MCSRPCPSVRASVPFLSSSLPPSPSPSLPPLAQAPSRRSVGPPASVPLLHALPLLPFLHTPALTPIPTGREGWSPAACWCHVQGPGQRTRRTGGTATPQVSPPCTQAHWFFLPQRCRPSSLSLSLSLSLPASLPLPPPPLSLHLSLPGPSRPPSLSPPSLTSYSRRSVDPPARSPVQPSVRPSGISLPTRPSVLQPVRPASPLSPSPILWIRQPIRPPARPTGRPAGQPSARPSVGQSASQSVNPPLPLCLPYLPEAQVNGDALLCIDVVDAGRILCKEDIRGSSSQHPPLPVEVI